MRTVIMSLALLLGGLFVHSQAFAQKQPVLVDVKMSLDKNVITQHEPAILNLAFENQSEKNVVINLGDEDGKLQVSVVDPTGQTRHKPKPQLRGFGNGDVFYVPAGQTLVGSVALNEWFGFETIGRYQIEVSISPDSLPTERFDYHLNSNAAVLNLTVVPRDAKVLEAACSSLATRAGAMQPSSNAMVAAKALANIHDPVVVPYLAGLADNNAFAGLMISALARLRTPAAMDALVQASESSNAETSKLALAALDGLRGEKK